MVRTTSNKNISNARIPNEVRLDSSELNDVSFSDPHHFQTILSDPPGSIAEEEQVQEPASSRRSLIRHNFKKTPSSRSVQFDKKGHVSNQVAAKRPSSISSRRELPIGSFHSRDSLPIGSFHSRGASTTGSGRRSTRSLLSIGKTSAHKTFRTIVNISKYKIKHRQPSKDAIVRMVDHWYAKFDVKKNTVADMYTAIEDHFVMKLSKTNRKVVRQRLVDLSTERALQRQVVQAMVEADDDMEASGGVSIISWGVESLEQDDYIFKSSLQGSARTLESEYAAPTTKRKKKLGLAAAETTTAEKQKGSVTKKHLTTVKEISTVAAVLEGETSPTNRVSTSTVKAKPSPGKKATSKKPSRSHKRNSEIVVLPDPPKTSKQSSVISGGSPKTNKSSVKSGESRKSKSSGVVREVDAKTIAENQNEEIVFGETTDHGEEADRAVAAEEGRPLVRVPTIPNRRSAELQSAMFAFDNIRHTVGGGDDDDDEIQILGNISGKIKCGHTLAILGSSGAGKTSLMNALTLDAVGGTLSGTVTLNGMPLTDKLLKQHAYIVRQEDPHWPYLTCREALMYAAQLCSCMLTDDIEEMVESVIYNIGLEYCTDEQSSRLTALEQRHLSIAIALLKQPTLLFLDEPTTGLNSAAAAILMVELRRLAKTEKMIILYTVRQPSGKVYNTFDKMLILSKGQQIFFGKMKSAKSHFAKLGFPCPPATNPAEHFLDLADPEFADEETFMILVTSWLKSKTKTDPEASAAFGGPPSDNKQDESIGGPSISLAREICILFRRQSVHMLRDPIYLGRCAMFLVANSFIAFIYWNTRPFTQDQVMNKIWLSLWFVGIPSSMGAMAVYSLNNEIKPLLSETKNGTVRAFSYVFTKSVLVLPIMLLFSLFSLGVPAYAIQQFTSESFGPAIILLAACLLVFEAIAECLSVWFEKPNRGVIAFATFWFASFLFSGFLLPESELYWPFKSFYYTLPFSYCLRSFIYAIFIDADFEECTVQRTGAICTDAVSGAGILDETSVLFPLISSEDTFLQDVFIMLAIAAFFKLCYIISLTRMAGRRSRIHEISSVS